MGVKERGWLVQILQLCEASVPDIGDIIRCHGLQRNTTCTRKTYLVRVNRYRSNVSVPNALPHNADVCRRRHNGLMLLHVI